MKDFRENGYNSPYEAPTTIIWAKDGTSLGELKEGECLSSVLISLIQNGVSFEFKHSNELHIKLDLEETLDYFRNLYRFESYGY